MRFQTVATQLAPLPLFESGLLYAYVNRPQQAQRQLSDWVRDGKVIQLRRGLYTLAEPYQTVRPHAFLIANHLVQGSYISLQMALGYYGLIPEHVEVVTSVTTGRPNTFRTTYGQFSYRHIHASLFTGFRYQHVINNVFVYIATPEKALLDLIHLTPDGDNPAYLRSLRLQNLDQLDSVVLNQLVAQLDKPKLKRAAVVINMLVAEEQEMYEPL